MHRLSSFAGPARVLGYTGQPRKLETLRLLGALNLTEPSHLLAKLEHEGQAVATDHGDSYAAINALRDAYHLREWIWHDRLKHDTALQTTVMAASGDKEHWYRWVNQRFPDFPVIRELCNGSKHFESHSRDSITATHTTGWDSPISAWDSPYTGWDDNGFHVQLDTSRLIPIAGLVSRVCDFWRDLFAQFPQLA